MVVGHWVQGLGLVHTPNTKLRRKKELVESAATNAAAVPINPTAVEPMWHT